MGSNLKYGSEQEGYAILDEFFKSLLFQEIMDGNFSRNERDVLLVIFRKTVHFDKWYDRISMHWLGKNVGIGNNTLRSTLDKLERKSVIEIERSTGGKTSSAKKYNKFSLSLLLVVICQPYIILRTPQF